MNYKNKILMLRRENGLSQREMALVLRVGHGTISLWETGKRVIPGPVTLILDNFELYLRKSQLNSCDR